MATEEVVFPDDEDEEDDIEPSSDVDERDLDADKLEEPEAAEALEAAEADDEPNG